MLGKGVNRVEDGAWLRACIGRSATAPDAGTESGGGPLLSQGEGRNQTLRVLYSLPSSHPRYETTIEKGKVRVGVGGKGTSHRRACSAGPKPEA